MKNKYIEIFTSRLRLYPDLRGVGEHKIHIKCSFRDLQQQRPRKKANQIDIDMTARITL